MNDRFLTKTSAERLNSCIRVESTKIDRRVSIPHRVSFCLDVQLLAQIEQIRASNSRFELSPSNLTNLRHYALLCLPCEPICDCQLRQAAIDNTSLTFATQYLAAENHTAVTLFRSAIDLEGKISQQVDRKLYQDSVLLDQISQAHYWLVLEILAQLPLKPKIWYSWFVSACFFVAIAIVCSLIWYSTPLPYLFKILVCFCIMLMALALKTTIIKKLRAWTIYHLLDGFFARSTYKKKVGLKLLSYFVAFN